MSTAKQVTTTKQPAKPIKQQPKEKSELFGKENYKLMLLGVVVLAIGYMLMVGGKSPDPTKFDDNVIYSITRITIAPIVIITGFIIEIFAIMKKPKKSA
jgi:hypothetical protein